MSYNSFYLTQALYWFVYKVLNYAYNRFSETSAHYNTLYSDILLKQFSNIKYKLCLLFETTHNRKPFPEFSRSSKVKSSKFAVFCSHRPSAAARYTLRRIRGDPGWNLDLEKGYADKDSYCFPQPLSKNSSLMQQVSPQQLVYTPARIP
jgi:hypothetical protein